MASERLAAHAMGISLVWFAKGWKAHQWIGGSKFFPSGCRTQKMCGIRLQRGHHKWGWLYVSTPSNSKNASDQVIFFPPAWSSLRFLQLRPCPPTCTRAEMKWTKARPALAACQQTDFGQWAFQTRDVETQWLAPLLQLLSLQMALPLPRHGHSNEWNSLTGSVHVRNKNSKSMEYRFSWVCHACLIPMAFSFLYKNWGRRTDMSFPEKEGFLFAAILAQRVVSELGSRNKSSYTLWDRLATSLWITSKSSASTSPVPSLEFSDGMRILFQQECY